MSSKPSKWLFDVTGERERVFCRWIYFHLRSKIFFWPSYGGGDRPIAPPWIGHWWSVSFTNWRAESHTDRLECLSINSGFYRNIRWWQKMPLTPSSPTVSRFSRNISYLKAYTIDPRPSLLAKRYTLHKTPTWYSKLSVFMGQICTYVYKLNMIPVRFLTSVYVFCVLFCRVLLYSLTGWAKKWCHKLMAIILLNLNWFSNFFSLADSSVNLQLSGSDESHRTLHMLPHWPAKQYSECQKTSD